MSEHDEQVGLFQWAALWEQAIPELSMLYAVPNGGQRHVAVGRRMKAEGVKAGVLDINLDVARGGYHGLRIEMKFGKNGLTAEQQEWVRRYSENGYSVAICYGWVEAKGAILHYLEGN